MAGEETRTGHALRLLLAGSAGHHLDARCSGAPLSHLLGAEHTGISPTPSFSICSSLPLPLKVSC